MHVNVMFRQKLKIDLSFLRARGLAAGWSGKSL
jgi:hypothetical protein